MKKLHLAVISVLVLGQPAFSSPVQTGHCLVPKQLVSLVLSPQPASEAMHRNSPRIRFMAVLSKASQMSRANGLCEVETIALMCTNRTSSAISQRAAK